MTAICAAPVCRTCERSARLGHELLRTRGELHTIETIHRIARANVAANATPSLSEIRAVLADQRLRVATIELALAELDGEHTEALAHAPRHAAGLTLVP